MSATISYQRKRRSRVREERKSVNRDCVYGLVMSEAIREPR
jgi:hypothetical protein